MEGIEIPPQDVEYDSAESSDGATLDIRIAAVFAILAASLIGGLPPLFVKVRDVYYASDPDRSISIGRSILNQ